MQRSALDAQPADEHEAESVVVHVQLRPRRGATRRCLASLAALAAEHPEASFSVTGLGKDDRVVRVTVGVDLGPRTAVARFSPQAQAAYAFVTALFTSLYDHMPIYTAEPSGAERAAAKAFLEQAMGAGHRTAPVTADVLEAIPARPVPAGPLPAPRGPGAGDRIPA